MLAHSMTNIQKYPEKDKGDMTIEAMKLALEALTRIWEDGLENFPESGHDAAITALCTAIAEAEKQEPRHIVQSNGRHSPLLTHMMNSRTTPPAAPVQEPVAWAKFLHYPECWDTAAYPTLHDAIHEALAWSGCSVCTPPAAQQEPVAWVNLDQYGNLHESSSHTVPPDTFPVYRHPPAAQRQPLTDEKIDDIWNRYCDEMGEASINDAYDITRAIEAAHGIKEKNT